MDEQALRQLCARFGNLHDRIRWAGEPLLERLRDSLYRQARVEDSAANLSAALRRSRRIAHDALVYLDFRYCATAPMLRWREERMRSGR